MRDRLAALRTTYPAPTNGTRAPEDFAPNVPVTLKHLMFRHRAAAPSGMFVVDSLFPATLDGRADTSHVDEGTADLLYGLIRALQPQRVLETGTHKGRSTRALVQALRDNAEVLLQPYCFTATIPAGHCWTVDAEDHHLLTSGAIPPAWQAYVTPILGWTPDVFTQSPLADLQGLEFAFLDGDHSAEGLDAELTYVDLHRAPECWVAIDNTRDPGWPGVARVLHEYRAYPRISLGTCTGLDLIWMSDAARSPRAETPPGAVR